MHGELGGSGDNENSDNDNKDFKECSLPSAPFEMLEKVFINAMLLMDSTLHQGGAVINSNNSSGNGSKNHCFNFVGSTAIIVAIDCGETDESGITRAGSPQRLIVSNCGDSRAVLCRNGKAVELSRDHKPELQSEKDRIGQAGGKVLLAGPCYRIDGWGLNLSRALGDFHYKARADLPREEQKVIAVPEIQTMELTEDDEFVVLGCDGVFELNSSQMVVDIVRQNLAAKKDVKEAVQVLLDCSCSPDLTKTKFLGGDNCSAIVIKLR